MNYTGNLISHYENELKKIKKEIEELWEVNKTSPSKLKRERELNLILDGLYANETIGKLKEKNRDLRMKLKMEGIEIDE